MAGFWKKVFNQVNPFDGGKTYKNPTPAPRPPQSGPRVDARALVDFLNATGERFGGSTARQVTRIAPAAASGLMKAVGIPGPVADAAQRKLQPQAQKLASTKLEDDKRITEKNQAAKLGSKFGQGLNIARDAGLTALPGAAAEKAVRAAGVAPKIAPLIANSLAGTAATNIRDRAAGMNPNIAKDAALGLAIDLLTGNRGKAIQSVGNAVKTKAGSIKLKPLDEVGSVRLPFTQGEPGADILKVTYGVPAVKPLMIKSSVPIEKALKVVDKYGSSNYAPPLKVRNNSGAPLVGENLSGAAQQSWLSKLKNNEGGYVRIPGSKGSKGGKQAQAKLEQAAGTAQPIPNRAQPIADAAFGTQTTAPVGALRQTNRSLQGDTPLLRTRGFVKTVIDDPNTDPKIKQSISSVYKVRNTKELQQKAATLVRENPDLAERIAQSEGDDVSVAVTSELMKKLQKEGNFERAVDLASTQAEVLTKAGQTAQAASIYGKLTPEGILRFTQKEIGRFNKQTGKNIKLDPQKAKKLTDLANKVQAMPEGYEKTVAIKQLLKEVKTAMPSTTAEKLGTLQTMAQLLNPKTNIRNIGGNTIFAGLENISQTVGTPVDKLLSAIRGSARTTALPSLKTQLKSGAQGGKTAVKEAYQGINTGQGTQFDLKDVPTFRNGALGALEKTMNATLRGADRAAYEAAYDDTIRGLLKANKTKVVTPEMLEQAHYTGLYRTFQDTNAISEFFTGMKKSLNKLGIGIEGNRFGLGDLVLKYPKTPANLLARGLDYSPAGFVKSTFEAARPLFGQEFDQKAFVDSFSRAVVGSGSAFGLGYVLADNGIITAQPEQNKDMRNLQKTAGLGGYQINASAFKRWVASGFNKEAGKLRPGDTLVSYDWAQPIAIPISAGASAGVDKPKKAGADAGNALLDSANTLVEQPLLQGVQRLFGGNGSITDAATQTVQDLPASFTPTALSQVNQLFDNKMRNTAAENPVTESLNRVKSKVPGLAQTLPAQVDVLGNEKERYQDGGNNPFNVLLNPAFVSKYKPNDTAQEALDLYQRTGETKQTPNTVPNKVDVNGQKRPLTAAEQGEYQRFIGQGTQSVYQELTQNPRYNGLTDSQKINILSNLQTDLNNAAKIRLFGDQPAKVSESVQSILDDNLGRSIELKLKGQEKSSAPKAKTPKVKKAKKAKVSKGRTRKGRSGSTKTNVAVRKLPTLRVRQAPKVRVAKSRVKPFKVKTTFKKAAKVKFKA